jgi:hypothetical protein
MSNLINNSKFDLEKEESFQKISKIRFFEHHGFNFFNSFDKEKTVSSSQFDSDNIIHGVSEINNQIQPMISEVSNSMQVQYFQSNFFARVNNDFGLRHDELSLRNDSLQEIFVNLFDEKYMMKVRRQHNIGDLRKTIRHWLDLDPSLKY